MDDGDLDGVVDQELSELYASSFRNTNSDFGDFRHDDPARRDQDYGGDCTDVPPVCSDRDSGAASCNLAIKSAEHRQGESGIACGDGSTST